MEAPTRVVVIVLPSWMLDAGAKGKPPIGSSASRRACRRQANTCCGVRPWRRAIWLTGAPSSKLSATIAAFCSAIQARRRPAPVKISSRCAGRETFDTSLRSEIAGDGFDVAQPSRTSVVALKSEAVAEKSKNQLSRDF